MSACKPPAIVVVKRMRSTGEYGSRGRRILPAVLEQQRAAVPGELELQRLYSAKIRSERQEGTQTFVEYEVADVHPAVLFLSHWPGGRESFPSKTVGHVPRAQGKATPDNGLNSCRDGCASKVLRLARRREARDIRQMASECLQDVLAMEVAQARTSGAAQRRPRAGSSDGPRKPNMGRGEDRG